MYSGRLVYQASWSATSGESMGSITKPLRMRCHRSGSGIGTSSMSSKAGGSATLAGGVSAAGARAGASARNAASMLTRQFQFMQLVLVSKATFALYAATRRASRKYAGHLTGGRAEGLGGCSMAAPNARGARSVHLASASFAGEGGH